MGPFTCCWRSKTDDIEVLDQASENYCWPEEVSYDWYAPKARFIPVMKGGFGSGRSSCRGTEGGQVQVRTLLQFTVNFNLFLTHQCDVWATFSIRTTNQYCHYPLPPLVKSFYQKLIWKKSFRCLASLTPRSPCLTSLRASPHPTERRTSPTGASDKTSPMSFRTSPVPSYLHIVNGTSPTSSRLTVQQAPNPPLPCSWKPTNPNQLCLDPSPLLLIAHYTNLALRDI